MATIKDLKFDDKNFNKHTEFGMSLLEKSLRENGAGRSILLDKDNNIIAGNGIVEAAGSVGLEKVKIVEATGDEIIAVKRTDISLNSEKGREMALADNATAKADIDWDKEALQSEFDDEELNGWGIDTTDWQEQEEVVEDEAPEVDETSEPDSKLGGVYVLGEHRLMCGDSTDAGSVAILMDGAKADLLITDPPYNVEIVGGSHGESIEERKKKGALTIKNDKMESDEFKNFLKSAFSTAESVMENGAAFYVWYASKEVVNFQTALEENNLVVRQELIWNKNSLVMGRQDYQWKHEPCLYGWKDGTHNWYSDRKQTTVIDFNRPTNSDDHPTMKPVELFAYQIQNSSKKNENVLDLFGGSGTTLVACEQLGRKCYMMELDPKYCDVIRKRYWKFKTGSEEGWQDGTKAIL
jgi:site-specific DNA-methyltransferase (adenine-specific)